MQLPPKIAHFMDSQFETVDDARYFPLLFTRSRGTPSAPVYDQFNEWRLGWMAHAAKQNTRCYLIAYVEEIRPPNAAVRKHIANSLADDKNHPGFLGTGTVVSNALIRGMVTAIAWIAGKERSGFGDNTATLPDAIRLAFQYYDNAGIARPDIDPIGYQLPEYPVGS